jgi:hypothetical protein
MGSGLIEVDDIGFEKPSELLLMQDEEVIQTFSPHASQKTFTDSIGLRRSIRRSQHVDACPGYLVRPLPKWTDFPIRSLLLATWYIRPKSSSFSENGCTK